LLELIGFPLYSTSPARLSANLYSPNCELLKLVHTIYHKGVRLTAKAMAFLEQRFERSPGLEKYFVLIRPQPQTLSG